MRTDVVILPDGDWPQLRSRWREAEALGFTTGWTYDHLSWRTLRDGPWLGSVPLLAAAAEATERMRLGTLVTSPNFRHPAVLAKDAMTLDRISGGRFTLGIGAGGTGYDADAVGLPPLAPAQRATRFAEFAEALDLLLREPAAEHRGEFFTAVASRTYPGCVQQPRVPFTVAAAGPKAMRVAAVWGDTWVTYGPAAGATSADEWFTGVGEQVERLAEVCRSVGREPSSLRRLALIGLEAGYLQGTVVRWRDTAARLADLGFTDVAVHWPRPADPDLPGPPPDVFATICETLP